ncbi:hypothetical protein ScoT_18520 [Streptomyces albidoflavus]|uniref:Uncharacterized protein n=1 Tax=Streptomyces albidoflavus TaxID=1886 RepID=A0AA37FEG2_9ACTN|nr:hypothetical protein ScoT_18520 [Streptomyces albidoflavus]
MPWAAAGLRRWLGPGATVPVPDGLKRRPGWNVASNAGRAWIWRGFVLVVPLTDGLKRRPGWSVASGVDWAAAPSPRGGRAAGWAGADSLSGVVVELGRPRAQAVAGPGSCSAPLRRVI